MHWKISKFQKKHFDALKTPDNSYNSPLEVIAHIDLDAFYAQCEQVRLNLSSDTPVACRQWNSLIAVNYAARKYDISRHDNAEEALKKCPEIVLAHVATYKKGQTTWKYWEKPSVVDHKVSLDPFRRESRRIFSVLKEHASIIEKASIDEAFLDLGPLIHKKAKELFPQLEFLGDTEDSMPESPTDEQLSDLQWHGIIVGDESSEQDIIETINDWDDIFIMIGSMIVSEIRADIKRKLKYTCSAGIARNKMLAKLGSGRNKPDQQTIVKASQIDTFLSESEIRDLWGYGGKKGEEICKLLHVPESESMQYLKKMSLIDFEIQLKDADLAQKLYKVVRGTFCTRVSPQMRVKSMNSVKQFDKPQKTINDCKDWLKVFSADVTNRILELEDEFKVRVRPKTIGIHYNLPYQKPRSRQMSFQMCPKQDFDAIYNNLFDSASRLFDIIYTEGSIIPAAMLSLVLTSIQFQANTTTLDNFFSVERNKMVTNGNETGFSTVESSNQMSSNQVSSNEVLNEISVINGSDNLKRSNQSLFVSDDEDEYSMNNEVIKVSCPQCDEQIDFNKQEEHKDWHFAMRLQEQEGGVTRQTQSTRGSQSNKRTQPTRQAQSDKSTDSTKKRTTKKTKMSNNQSILNYFKSE